MSIPHFVMPRMKWYLDEPFSMRQTQGEIKTKIDGMFMRETNESLRENQCTGKKSIPPFVSVLLLLPEEVRLLSVQPLLHLTVHAVPEPAVEGRGEGDVDVVAEPSLGGPEIAVALGVLGQLGGLEARSRVAVDGDDLVLLVKELDILGLPAAALLGRLALAEEDEAAVAVDVKLALGEGEAVRDGGLHLADGAVGRGAQLGQRAALSVHDEDAALLAGLGDVDEVVNVTRAAPCCCFC